MPPVHLCCSDVCFPTLFLSVPWMQILAYEETSETEGEDEGTKADGKESDKTDGVADAAAAAAAELKGSKAD